MAVEHERIRWERLAFAAVGYADAETEEEFNAARVELQDAAREFVGAPRLRPAVKRCLVAGCTRKSRAGGMCEAHYRRAKAGKALWPLKTRTQEHA